ncbi:hypothetical protein E1B28_001871 [Marasmius oreades]|uniref:F-box domain-containing protein n=1 Tax=Marasmius oreades TaxID=181124 RepID=A0A9P7V491_9AGAR|nr:uncharacterized protein E1B28_001871 [Marasmius oreades]KAG7100090.1 hypothetical protein E1B28_001871 [Marasmius oreades]
MAPTVVDLLIQTHEKQKNTSSQKTFKITPTNRTSSSCQTQPSDVKPEPYSEKPKTRVISFKRSAKLHLLPSLPLDLLFEIFGHLLPSDILQLARTSRDLRNLLLRRSATTIWKTAFLNVADISCPRDISYPAWASLIYDKECHGCSIPNIRNVNFFLRVRLCAKCAKHRLSDVERSEEEEEIKKIIQDCVPCAEWGGSARTVCVAAKVNGFLEELQRHTLRGEAARLAFIEERKVQLVTRNQNARLWAKWTENLQDVRQQELDDIRSKRSDALKKKLKAEGYEPELLLLDQLQRPWSSAVCFPLWDHHQFVKQPKPLTDRNWDQIKSDLVTYMETVRAYRLREERQKLVWERRHHATAEWVSYRTDQHLVGEFIPNPIDVWFWNPVKTVVEEPSDVVVNDQSFGQPMLGFPAFLRRWQGEKQDELVRLLPFPMAGDLWYARPQHLRLAICVLSCTSSFHCEFDEWPERHYPCMWFPEFLHHPCNTLERRACRYNFADGEKQDPIDKEVQRAPCLRADNEFKGFRRRKWSTKWVAFDQKASRTVQNILKACGMSLHTTTEQLDAADPRVVCLKCTYGAKCDGERRFPVLTWRTAVQHCFAKHWGDGTVAWQKVSDDDAALARTSECMPVRRIVQIPEERPWRCGHCKDTPQDRGRMTFTDMQEHFDVAHGGREGMEEGVHYYKAFDFPPRQPPVVTMVPKDPTAAMKGGTEML